MGSPRPPPPALLRLFVGFLAASSIAGAAEPPSLQNAAACLHDDPDSLQIVGWDAPCQDGLWLMDTQLGCRMWDWHPAPEDKITWTGTCQGGAKIGHGVLQWYEHGQPIDRFEGTFVDGQREGYGRYAWNKTDWYEGIYKNNVPHGPGAANIAGEFFVGRWKRGCFVNGSKVLAIGVPGASCKQRDE